MNKTFCRILLSTFVLLLAFFSYHLTSWAALQKEPDLAIAATTYYVSSSTGDDDANDGLSEAAPWQTIQKVNLEVFNPGDSILFKRGDTWNYALAPSGSGADGAPITYGAYGSGAKPLINATDGPVSSFAVVWINEKDYITIDGLEMTGNRRYGIRITHSDHLTIQNSYVHHILAEMWHCVVGGGDYLKILNNEIAYCGLEAYYGSGEHIEIAHNHMHHTDMVSETNGCTGGGDNVQLNCWSPDYHVHHNIFDHSNTCGGKGAFISSHCTLACSSESRCTEDVSTHYSNGLFEYNTILSGPNDNFGFTNSGYGDTVRHNKFYFDSENLTPGADFALKSEKGVVFNHNVVDGYGTAISLGKEGSIFKVYNNLFTNTTYTFWGSTDDRTATVSVNNNLFIDFFQHTRSNANQTYRFSHNVSTEGFGSGTSGTGTLIDDGNNTITNTASLLLTDIANEDYHPLENSPLRHAGIDVGLPYQGTAPTVGPFEYTTLNHFSWSIFLPTSLKGTD